MLQLLNFKDFWSEIGRAVMSFNSISDVLDVILVTFVIYSAIKLIRETKAVQLAKGFILLLIVYALVNLFGMQASNYILSLVFKRLLYACVFTRKRGRMHHFINRLESKIASAKRKTEAKTQKKHCK